jgi:hypothetical protein
MATGLAHNVTTKRGSLFKPFWNDLFDFALCAGKFGEGHGRDLGAHNNRQHSRYRRRNLLFHARETVSRLPGYPAWTSSR